MEDMSRLNRIAEFWNWLPAFRAVAEIEHVGEASEKVFKSPSALSRSVRLLEEALETELFERDGRRIRLTEQGEEFLELVRKAMRIVHEGMRRVSETEVKRDVYLSSPEWFGWMLEEPTAQVTESLESVALHLTSTSDPDQPHQLLQGDTDVMFAHVPLEHEKLEVELQTHLENAIYVGPEHQLSSVDSLEPEECADVSFVAPESQEVGPPPDGWPRELRRKIACRVGRPRLAARLAARGDHATVLPRRFVEESGASSVSGLVEVPADFLLETPLFLIRRSQLVDGDPEEAVITIVEDGL